MGAVGSLLVLFSRRALSGAHWAIFMRREPVRAVGPPIPRCYSVDRSSAGPHAAHQREGRPAQQTLSSWTLLHHRQTLGQSAGLCVRCFQPSLSLRSCSSLVCCSASVYIPCAVAVLFCLRTCVLLCPRTSFPGPPLGGAVTEVLHDLLCGLALSTVRHDLPSKKKKKKKPPRGSLPCGVRPRSGAALDSRAPRAPPH